MSFFHLDEGAIFRVCCSPMSWDNQGTEWIQSVWRLAEHKDSTKISEFFGAMAMVQIRNKLSSLPGWPGKDGDK